MSGSKRALITGINGKDESYLAEFLLSKCYGVRELLEVNGKLWKIEDRLRNCERASDFSDSFV